MANGPKKTSLRARDSIISDVLFDSIGEGAVIIDERGNIARINNIALEMLGYSRKELLGKWYPDAFVTEDEAGNRIPNIERPILEVFLSGKPVYTRIYFRKKGGGRIPVALTVSPILLKGKPAGAIELFRDITDELQLEHAKDEFISIASHQLRTPATVVKQYLGMVLGGYVDPDNHDKMLRLAYEHNENQLNIINELLQVAQAEANRIIAVRKRTDLIKLIKQVMASQKIEYNSRHLKLDLQTKNSSLFCDVDPLHIQMVFENLVNNSIKYSLDDSTVKISVDANSSNVIIKVKDKGIGIEQTDIPNLFKKFSRSENVNYTVSGTGLGLYWAKKLVKLHDGTIELDSELGKGTTVTVCLPRVEQT